MTNKELNRYKSILNLYKATSEKSSIEINLEKLTKYDQELVFLKKQVKSFKSVDDIKQINAMYQKINSYMETAKNCENTFSVDESLDSENIEQIKKIVKLSRDILYNYRALMNMLLDKKIEIVKQDIDNKVDIINSKTDESVKKIEDNVSNITFTIISIVVGISVVSALVEVLKNLRTIGEMIFILFSALFISVTIMIMASIIFKGFKKEQIILYIFYIILMIIWFCLGINYIEKEDDIIDISSTQIKSENIDVIH